MRVSSASGQFGPSQFGLRQTESVRLGVSSAWGQFGRGSVRPRVSSASGQFGLLIYWHEIVFVTDKNYLECGFR